MLPEVTVTEALDIIETVMSAQNLYNPTTIAALHHARRALAENAELRAALARAEQTVADARRAEALCEKHSLRDEKDMLRIAEKLDRAEAALGRMQPVVEAAKAWRAHIVDPIGMWGGEEDFALYNAVEALAADVPAAADELVEPDPTRTCPTCGTSWTAEVGACPQCPAPAVLPPTPNNGSNGEVKP